MTLVFLYLSIMSSWLVTSYALRILNEVRVCHFLCRIPSALSYRLGRHIDSGSVPRMKASSARLGYAWRGGRWKKNSDPDPSDLGVTVCLLSPEMTLPPPSQPTALTCVPKVAWKMHSVSRNPPASQCESAVRRNGWGRESICAIAFLGLRSASSGCHLHNPSPVASRETPWVHHRLHRVWLTLRSCYS